MERLDLWYENGIGDTITYSWPAVIRHTLRDETDAKHWIDVYCVGELIGAVGVSSFGKKAPNIFDAMRALQSHLTGVSNHPSYEGHFYLAGDRAPFTMFPRTKSAY